MNFRKSAWNPEDFAVGPWASHVKIRRSDRARTTRLLAKDAEIELVVPPGVSSKLAANFLIQNREWVEAQWQSVQTRKVIAASNQVLIGGNEIAWSVGENPDLGTHVPEAYRGERTALICPGASESLAKEELLWAMKTHSNDLVEAEVRLQTERMGVSPRNVRVRDQKTKWGSCSAGRNLNFSWRLVMAPPRVLSYLVIHEMAHLTELNHSDRFWAIVAKHCPDYRSCEAWLKREQRRLMLAFTQ